MPSWIIRICVAYNYINDAAYVPKTQDSYKNSLGSTFFSHFCDGQHGCLCVGVAVLIFLIQKKLLAIDTFLIQYLMQRSRRATLLAYRQYCFRMGHIGLFITILDHVGLVWLTNDPGCCPQDLGFIFETALDPLFSFFVMGQHGYISNARCCSGYYTYPEKFVSCGCPIRQTTW